MWNMNEVDYISIIKRIVNFNQEKLTDWELEFISSVYDNNVLKGYNLSDKQKEIIIKINRKVLTER